MASKKRAPVKSKNQYFPDYVHPKFRKGSRREREFLFERYSHWINSYRRELGVKAYGVGNVPGWLWQNWREREALVRSEMITAKDLRIVINARA